MGHIFRIRIDDKGKTPIVDWSNSPCTTYDHGYVDKIQDTTTTQNEITSIPSPFARIELVKEAFGKIVPNPITHYSSEEVKKLLHGNTIYHKMVSDSLDVAQIFFSYPSMKDKVEIKVWDAKNCINQLIGSSMREHQVYGKTLEMFFDQDAKGADPYNFGKMKNIYILKYIGSGQRPMHVIGATSPATLFFSTANDEKAISQHLCFGTDYAFDDSYASLDQRDPEFLKYYFALRYSDPHFPSNYPEVTKYLEAVYFVLDDKTKTEINQIEHLCSTTVEGSKSYLESNYDALSVPVSPHLTLNVEVNGRYLHFKTITPGGNSDFEIKPTAQIELDKAPYVLPVNNSNVYEDLEYYGCKFGRKFHVPYFDSNNIDDRSLPGINIPYPYLTISDFLEDKIIKLPLEMNTDDYFNGNFTTNSSAKDGYLLPIKPLFFNYFSTETLKGKAPSGKNTIDMKTVASGVEVTLRIPIVGGEVEYKRIYTLDVKADQENNYGAIVVAPENFVVGVIPPIEFSDEKEAHYRIAILTNYALNKECSCECFKFGDVFTPDYVVRNIDIEGDIRSKVYLVDKKRFDGIIINILTDWPGREQRATGLIIPKFKKRVGSSVLKFAIDLGTSNTHIEYSTSDNQMPKPFEFEDNQPQMSLICKPSDVIRSHVRGEFIPEAIGAEMPCHFPMRTVLCIDRINAGINESNTGPYVAFGNASPAFMYNKEPVGSHYNDYIPNLKWSQLSTENEEQIRCYIESLFIMIRNKVIQEGGSLSQTQIKWFYPISMSNNKLGLFKKVWTSAYKKYFNPTGAPEAITESIAPYSFFQKTMSCVANNIVTIDIGGETTDIVVADMEEVKCVTSMRFATDAIFGHSLIDVKDGALNGIIKQFKNEFITKLNGLNDLQEMLKKMTDKDCGNSSEVASFLFSLSENEQVIEKHLENQIDFNNALTRDNSQKIVFYIFFTAIMYHIAKLMKAKGLPAPKNIAFSGNGSKVVSVLSPSKESLEKLTINIFKFIYGTDISPINLIINSKNPKEATCKGGLFLDGQPKSVANAKTVLLGIDDKTLVESQKYSEVLQKDKNIVKKEICKNISNEVMRFANFIILHPPVPLRNEFGIDEDSRKLAEDCFNGDLNTFIERGVNLKLNSKDVGYEDIIEETFFFYPIIGVINNLSERIYNQSKKNT